MCIRDRCSSLETIEYSRFDINVERIADFFFGCSSLRTIDADNLVKEQTQSIGNFFGGCSSLESIDLSNWNTSSVTDMSGLFNGCSKLESIDLSSFVTYNVTSMSGLFSGCKNLKQIKLGNGFNTENVTGYGLTRLFLGCSSLDVIDLSKFSTSKVLSFEGLFDGCSSLKEIIWGDNFDTHYAEGFRAMFGGCSSIENLDLSWFNMSSSRNLMSMFEGCTNLKTLNISSFTTEHIEENGIFSIFLNCKKLSELYLGNQFIPTDFSQAFWDVAADIDGKCKIHCSETFMNNLSRDSNAYACFDPRKATWINCDTGNEMTFPAAN